MCVERSVSGEGRGVYGVGGGFAGLSFCVRMHREQGEERSAKVKHDLHTHRRKAVKNVVGGKSLWDKCVDVMWVRRVVLE